MQTFKQNLENLRGSVQFTSDSFEEQKTLYRESIQKTFLLKKENEELKSRLTTMENG